jgi:hypothetical protein
VARASRSKLRQPWVAVLAALVALRVAIPLAALAASGHALPGLPRFTYVGLTGDATGFYAAAREFIAAGPRLGKPAAALLALALAGSLVALFLAWRRSRLPAHWALVAGALCCALAVTVVIIEMHPPGAAVFGWPLLWSLPLIPMRIAGRLDPDIAFGFGLALSLLANAVTLVATAYIGLRVTGRRSAGLLAAALYAFWPLLVGLVAGERSWQNGSWEIDAGLHMYTEPLSTALVTGALALLLSARATAFRIALAGVLFSYASLTKLSNGFLAALVLVLCLRHFGLRRSLPFLLGGLTFAPAVIAYWPRGYVPVFDNPKAFPQHPFELQYFARNWEHSLVFSPRTLIVLVPVAVLGAATLQSRFARALLALPVLLNAAIYSFYENTVIHPRFLYVSLPAVFVLWAAGFGWVMARARRLIGHREAPVPGLGLDPGARRA